MSVAMLYGSMRQRNAQFRQDSDEWTYYWGYADCSCGATLVLQSTRRKIVDDCFECGRPIEVNLGEVV